MNTIQVSIGLLLMSVYAATSLGEERARGSLDILLSTPLSSRAILAGKWWGAFRLAPYVLLWPALMAGLLVVNGGRWIGYLLLMGLILAYAAGVASLGLAIATWVRRPGRATAICVSVCVVFTIGWLVLSFVWFRDDSFSNAAAMGSPLFGTPLATQIAAARPNYGHSAAREIWVGALSWILIHTGVAAALFAVTVATFDRCLGRVPERSQLDPLVLDVAVGLLTALIVVNTSIRADDKPAGRNSKASSPIVFRDMAAEAGVSFRFQTGTRDRHDLPEIMGGGVALFDADGDGLLDIYLCNGGPIEPAPGKPDPPCRLYRNRGGWQFEDITETAGAPGPSYAMGAAVGDYDGDGQADLFVSGWRDQRLYRGKGGGRFEDVTARSGLISHLWSTSAAFADLDGDGDQDLYVANYVDYDPKSAPYCAAPDGRRDYCGPENFRAQPDRLYRNNGDGTFTDCSQVAGIDLPEGRGLGIVIAELTGDNRPDIYVANDGTSCWLFANQGQLHFQEIGEKVGVARDSQGCALAGMGVAVGDLDGDGLAELVVTNFYDRSTIAYRTQVHPHAIFVDSSNELGLTATTRTVLGFGVATVDLDGDGHTDLIQANGHVLDRARLGIPFAMRPTLLHNTGGRFRDVTRSSGSWFDRPILGRGLAIADLDRDGRPDVVACALDAPAALLSNKTKSGYFLNLELLDRHGRPAFGARVRVTAGGLRQTGVLAAGGSYLASSQPVLFIGVGSAKSAERVEVAWPWGQTESWTRPSVPERGPLLLKQGTGQPES